MRMRALPYTAKSPPSQEYTPDMATSEQILEALKTLQSSVGEVKGDIDDVKVGVSKIESAIAVNEERWRGAEKEGVRIEKQIHELDMRMTTRFDAHEIKITEQRIGYAKLAGYATGAGAIVSIVVSIVISLVLKLVK